VSKVLLAGLPAGLAASLADRLRDALVQVSYSGEETLPVMLDVDMPYLSGIELCRVLRSDVRRGATLPVLFLTASTDPETVYRVFAAGADDYVRKPIVGPELVARIRNLLERVRALSAKV
jgi:DNA-binding response OmpR family regulator